MFNNMENFMNIQNYELSYEERDWLHHNQQNEASYEERDWLHHNQQNEVSYQERSVDQYLISDINGKELHSIIYFHDDIDPEYINNENSVMYYEYWDEEQDEIEIEIKMNRKNKKTFQEERIENDKKMIKKFKFLPIDIVLEIISFSDRFSIRNGGIIVNRFDKNDKRYKIIDSIPEKYVNPYENTTYVTLDIQNNKKYVLSIDNTTGETKFYIDIYVGFLTKKANKILQSILASIVLRITLSTM